MIIGDGIRSTNILDGWVVNGGRQHVHRDFLSLHNGTSKVGMCTVIDAKVRSMVVAAQFVGGSAQTSTPKFRKHTAASAKARG